MWWPFSRRDSEARKQRIVQLETKTSESRANMYSELFEFEAMVRRSLVLLGAKKNDPPAA